MNCTTFFDAIFGEPGPDEAVLVSYPSESGGHVQRYWTGEDLTGESWYYCCSLVKRAPVARRRGVDCLALAVIVLDDIGGKYPAPPLEPSYKLETSEGNFQWGYILAEMADDEAAMSAAEGAWRGLCDAGYSDQVATRTRVMRVPGSVHRTGFVARVTDWHPERLFSLDDLLRGMAATPRLKGSKLEPLGGADDLVPWLVEHLDGDTSTMPMTVRCPWAHEHTDGRAASGYFPAGSGGRLTRGWKCLHSHCAERGTTDFLAATAAMGAPRVGTSGAAPLAHWRDAVPRVGTGVLPDLRVNAKGAPCASQPVTGANIEAVVDAMGITCKFNRMTKVPELTAAWHSNPKLVRAELHSACILLGLAATAAIDDHVAALASARSYHPLGDAIRAATWDGVDRWPAFLQTVTATPDQDPELVGVLVRRWVLQAVKGWTLGEQERCQLGGVLVLVGAQGIGKSRWFKRLHPATRDGLIAPHIKDTILQALAAPVFEMSELEGTFRKADLAALKAFITQEEDVLRTPYARTADCWGRQTAFGASVNEHSFLADHTGNRRFWCIGVDHLDADHEVDLMQLYAQALAELDAGEPWWLQPGDAALQSEAAARFSAPCEVAGVLGDFLETRLSRPASEWCAVTAVHIARVVGMQKTDRRNLGILKNLLIDEFGPEQRFGKKSRRGWRFPVTVDELSVLSIRPIDW